jgi:hypothetical protein
MSGPSPAARRERAGADALPRDDWRLERMRSAVAEVDLPGEWDPERSL